MTLPSPPRTQPQSAGPELAVLARFETFTEWFLRRTARWPKRLRHTLTNRLENHALDIVETLVAARYRRQDRSERLDEVNLRLERMRHLLRLARTAEACATRPFEHAMRELDTVGRMLHGWRSSIAKQEQGP